MGLRLEREERPGLAGPGREAEGGPPPSGDSAWAGLPAAREALVNPRQQLRNAVALQIGQLNELVLVLRRFEALMERTGVEWSGWIDRSHGVLEAGNRSLAELAQAKARQEELLLALDLAWTRAREEDAARLEAGLKHLDTAGRALRAATEEVCGSGKGFQVQIQAGLSTLDGRLADLGDRVTERLDRALRRGLRPLVWIGTSLGLLVALDILVRLLT